MNRRSLLASACAAVAGAMARIYLPSSEEITDGDQSVMEVISWSACGSIGGGKPVYSRSTIGRGGDYATIEDWLEDRRP